MKILITRPLDDSILTVQNLIEAGFEANICPLLKIEKIKDLNFDGNYLITSSNALASIKVNPKKLFVLGAKTADLAKSFGFENVIYLGDNIKEVRTGLPEVEKIIYASGEDVTNDLKDFKNVTREIVYKATPEDKYLPILYKFMENSSSKIILFYSYRTAEQFLRLISGLDVKNNDIILVCISEKICNLLKSNGFINVFFPNKPTAEEMISLTKEIYIKFHERKRRSEE